LERITKVSNVVMTQQEENEPLKDGKHTDSTDNNVSATDKKKPDKAKI